MIKTKISPIRGQKILLIMMMVLFIAYLFIPLSASAATNGKLKIINEGDTPTKPPNLVAQVLEDANGKKYFYLKWGASTDKCSGIKRYNIYRNGILVASTTNRTYTDYKIDDKTRYRYQVVAVDHKEHISKPSQTPILTKYNPPAIKVIVAKNLINKDKKQEEYWIRSKTPTILDKVNGTTRIIYAQNNTISRVPLPTNLKQTNITTHLNTTFNTSINDFNNSIKGLNNTSLIKNFNITVNNTINNSVKSFNSSVNNSVKDFNTSFNNLSNVIVKKISGFKLKFGK